MQNEEDPFLFIFRVYLDAPRERKRCESISALCFAKDFSAYENFYVEF